MEIEVSKFPWATSGRALTLNRTDGLTKIITHRGTGRIIGVGIVGPQAGELISEAVLAIEMGATAEDMAFSIHPSPDPYRNPYGSGGRCIRGKHASYEKAFEKRFTKVTAAVLREPFSVLFSLAS